MISRKSGHTEPEKYYNLKYIHKMKSILNFPALNSILDFIVLCHSLPFFLFINFMKVHMNYEY